MQISHDYWVSSLCPLSGTLKNTKDHFRNWICFLPLERGGTPTLLGPSEMTTFQRLRLVSEILYYFVLLEYWTTEKVGKPRYPDGHTQSSEPITIYIVQSSSTSIQACTFLCLCYNTFHVRWSSHMFHVCSQSGLINKHTSRVLTKFIVCSSTFILTSHEHLCYGLFSIFFASIVA
jgi:hypothetical protein